MLSYLSKDKDLKNDGIVFGEEADKTFIGMKTEKLFAAQKFHCKIPDYQLKFSHEKTDLRLRFSARKDFY